MKTKKAKESNIDLNIQSVNNSEEELQRTEKWKKERNGKWTSSGAKSLMSCGRTGGKISWNEKEKVYDFGKTTLKCIYENAMARKRGRYIESGEGTKKMQYGTRVEPLIFAIAAEKLKHIGVLENVGFKHYPKIKTAGVSSDGIFRKNTKVIAAYEAKATTNWQTHFDRTFDLLDEKGVDFWQTQSHMVAWEVPTCYYAIAEPPHDISKYLYYEGDIMDLLDEFKKECKVTIQEVNSSPMHQNAILKRIKISEKIIKRWNKRGGDLRAIMHETIKDFKNKDGFEKVVFTCAKNVEVTEEPKKLFKFTEHTTATLEEAFELPEKTVIGDKKVGFPIKAKTIKLK